MVTRKSRGIPNNVRTYKLRTNISGMAQNRAEAFLRTDQAVDILNGHCLEEGSWSFDKAGYLKLNAGGAAYEGGASVDGVAVYTDSSLVDHLFIASNGKLKEVNTTSGAATNIDASAGYGLGAKVDFQQFFNVLFTVDGTINAPRKWDGTTASTAAGWPVSDGVSTYSKPIALEAHQHRLVFLVGDKVIVSDFENGESFTFTGTSAANGFLDQVGEDGLPTTGCKAIHVPATNDSQVIITKASSIYVLTGSSGKTSDADTFKLVKVNGNYGAINNRCIVQVGNDLLMLNEYGVISYTSSTQSGTVQPQGINSDLVKDVIGRLNRNAKAQCWGVHLPDRREVWFFLPTDSSSVCNEAIVFKYASPGDSTTPKWSRRKDVGSKFLCNHGAILAGQFYIGLSNGIVGQMFASSLYDDTGIPWIYEFPYWDVGNEQQYKRFTHGEAHFKVRSPQAVNLQTTWRGGGCNDTLTQTLDIDPTITGAIYGAAYYGTAYYGAQEELKEQFEAPGDGLKIKFILSGTTVTTGPEFLGMTMAFELGNISGHWH